MSVRIREWGANMMQQIHDVSAPYRQFVPSEEGESLDDQIFPWSFDGIKQDMQSPLTIHEGDPQTITNIMQMMSVEMQHWMDYYAFASMTADPDFKKMLGSIARAEHLHHLKLMSLLPVPHDASEMVLQGELAMMIGYGMCMGSEPNGSINDAFRLMFLDHQTHAQFAADQVKSKGCDPKMITGGADLSGGRPLDQQFMKPDDTIWKGRFDGSYDKTSVDPQTLINVDMALAGELAAWDIYNDAMGSASDQNARVNYGAFQSIEDQHGSMLESIKDPSETALERSLVHEQVEIRNYQRLMDEEANPQVKKVFQDLYREDLEQARLFGRFVM